MPCAIEVERHGVLVVIQPEAYDPKLDVDFTPLREQDQAVVGFGQAA